MNSNAASSLATLLRCLDVKYSKSTLRKLIAHPHYPSLLSISYVLNDLGIENVAVKAEYHKLLEFPMPILVHVKSNGGSFSVVSNVDEGNIAFVGDQGRIAKQTRESFLNEWSGIAVIVRKTKEVAEVNYTENKVRDFFVPAKYLLAAALFAFSLLEVFVSSNTGFFPFVLLYLVTHSVGLALSSILLMKIIDKDNRIFQRFCMSSRSNSKIDCASVLDSKMAYFLGEIPWSEIGFVYFATFVFCLFFHSTPGTIAVTSLFSLASSAYIIYSIFIQWRILKQWCRLCLFIQGVLFCNLVISIISLIATPTLTFLVWNDFMRVIYVGLMVGILYSIVKPVLSEWYFLKREIGPLYRIKLSQDVFEVQLRKQRSIGGIPYTPLKFGRDDAKHKILLVANPHCAPCVELHGSIKAMLRRKTDTQVCEVILTDPNTRTLGELMLSLFEKFDEGTATQLVDEYYELWNNDINTAIEYFGNLTVTPRAKRVLDEHFNWCKANMIFGTPYVFYNGFEMPKGYTIKDLDFIID